MDNQYYESAADINKYFCVMKTDDNFTPAHFHNSMEIVLVTGGVERIVINGVERVLREGDIAVCNSFDVHYYESLERAQSTVIILSEEYTARYRELFEGELASFLPRCEYTGELMALFETLYRNRSENRLIVSGYVDVILGTLRKAYPDSVSVSRSNGNRLSDILVYIEENFDSDLSLKSVSAHFGYSVNYFSALFNRFTGMHFRDYINRLRIARADMLIGSGCKVGDALARCGFDSPNSYYRAKKRWGAQTP